MTTDIDAQNRMRKLIERLLKDAPKLHETYSEQAPAIACVVSLVNGLSMEGALATAEGMLRMMCIIPDPATRRPTMVEHFFDYGSVMMVSLKREVTATTAAPKLWPIS
jgi:hypothetical protein